MKLTIIYLILGIAAVAAGVGSAHLYHNSLVEATDEAFFSDQWEISDPSTLEAQASVAPGTVWDVGTIDPEKSYSRDFIITNKGTKQLQIWLDAETKGPVQVELGSEKVGIDLNASYPVTVRIQGSEIKEELDVEIIVSTNQAGDEPVKLKVLGKLTR